ncbi:leucine-rich melanocyte differentiation-associated protein-like [Rhopilema esculentum]|uniref:leucine-rich melanocyte differentiation-associated protein-like n=1 Tax=Rhopilema esculentum TaxID=499914 RepID=UPI0031DD93AF
METIYSDGTLTFVGQDCECIPPWLSRKYGNVTKRLDLSYNRLRSLKGLVGFNVLEELLLDNNQLKDDIELPELPSLTTLTLNKNKINDIEKILDKTVSKLPKLSYLSLLGNPACPNQLISMDKDDADYQRYRYYVIHRIPSLKFLDSTPVKETEHKEALRVGALMKVVSSEKGKFEAGSESDSEDEAFSPLPTEEAELGDHKGTFGKCRYVYYGKHSEGNRFILNNDL